MSTADYSVRVPARPSSLKLVRAFYEPILRAACEALAEPLVLALDEACANLVKHRCPTIDDGHLDVDCALDPDRLEFRITAFCKADDIAGIRPRDLEDVRPGGLGTHFIGEIMDRVSFEPEDDDSERMTLVLEKRLDDAGESGHR